MVRLITPTLCLINSCILLYSMTLLIANPIANGGHRRMQANCQPPCYYDPKIGGCRCDSMHQSRFHPDKASSPADCPEDCDYSSNGTCHCDDDDVGDDDDECDG